MNKSELVQIGIGHRVPKKIRKIEEMLTEVSRYNNNVIIILKST